MHNVQYCERVVTTYKTVPMTLYNTYICMVSYSTEASTIALQISQLHSQTVPWYRYYDAAYLPRIWRIWRFWSRILVSARSTFGAIRSIWSFCAEISSPRPSARFFRRVTPDDICSKKKCSHTYTQDTILNIMNGYTTTVMINWMSLISNKMQSETADFNSGAATWWSGRNASCLRLICSINLTLHRPVASRGALPP